MQQESKLKKQFTKLDRILRFLKIIQVKKLPNRINIYGPVIDNEYDRLNPWNPLSYIFLALMLSLLIVVTLFETVIMNGVYKYAIRPFFYHKTF